MSHVTAQPIVIAISQSKRELYPFEEVFRSQNKLIVDTVCKEFVFVLELFDLKMSQVANIFNKIFAKVVNRYLQWLQSYNSL
jgi:phenylalanine-4-hydroxylase